MRPTLQPWHVKSSCNLHLKTVFVISLESQPPCPATIKNKPLVPMRHLLLLTLAIMLPSFANQGYQANSVEEARAYCKRAVQLSLIHI